MRKMKDTEFSAIRIKVEEMNMVEYKHYDRSLEDEVVKVFTESFVNYPLFLGNFRRPLQVGERVAQFLRAPDEGDFPSYCPKG